MHCSFVIVACDREPGESCVLSIAHSIERYRVVDGSVRTSVSVRDGSDCSDGIMVHFCACRLDTFHMRLCWLKMPAGATSGISFGGRTLNSANIESPENSVPLTKRMSLT